MTFQVWTWYDVRSNANSFGDTTLKLPLLNHYKNGFRNLSLLQYFSFSKAKKETNIYSLQILVDDTEEGKSRLRLAMNDVNTPVLVTFGTGSLYGQQSRNVKSMPENVHLLTLEPISGK